MKIIILLIFIHVFTACQEQKTINQELSARDSVFISIYRPRVNDSSKNIFYFEKSDSDSTIDLLYLDTLNSEIKYSNHMVRLIKSNASGIYYFNTFCPLLGFKEIRVNKQSYLIKKYIYDNLQSNDEESYLYVNDSSGLILYYNIAWGNFIVFNDSKVTYSINRFLIFDTSGFVPYSSNRIKFLQGNLNKN